jgi:hypothetical protein
LVHLSLSVVLRGSFSSYWEFRLGILREMDLCALGSMEA